MECERKEERRRERHWELKEKGQASVITGDNRVVLKFTDHIYFIRWWVANKKSSRTIWCESVWAYYIINTHGYDISLFSLTRRHTSVTFDGWTLIDVSRKIHWKQIAKNRICFWSESRLLQIFDLRCILDKECTFLVHIRVIRSIFWLYWRLFKIQVNSLNFMPFPSCS